MTLCVEKHRLLCRHYQLSTWNITVQRNQADNYTYIISIIAYQVPSINNYFADRVEHYFISVQVEKHWALITLALSDNVHFSCSFLSATFTTNTSCSVYSGQNIATSIKSYYISNDADGISFSDMNHLYGLACVDGVTTQTFQYSQIFQDLVQQKWINGTKVFHARNRYVRCLYKWQCIVVICTDLAMQQHPYLLRQW